MNQIKGKNFNKHSGITWRILIYYGQLIKEFLQSTVLNGLKYLTYKYLKIWERLFFLCCLIAAFYNSFHFALTIVEKWKTSPVITVMNPRTNLIANEPFPAITICNMNQVQYSKVKDIDINSLDYAMLKKACFSNFNFTAYAHLKRRSEDDNLFNFFLKNSQNCSDMIAMCYYGSKKRTCSDLFREILLDEGLCCTFNMVHPYLMYKGDHMLVREYTSIDGPMIPLDWNPEEGYSADLPDNFYPRPPFREGVNNGLTVILNGDYDNYYCSSSSGPGFKILIHSPIDNPNVYENGLPVNLGLETSIRLTPYKEESDKKLRTSTTPEQRQCYFTGEYSLIYFRYYTRRNCEVECDAKFLLRKCNCLSFHLPVISENATDCHVKHFNCFSEVEKDFSDEEFLACRKECLPSCIELTTHPTPFFTILGNNGFQIKNPFLRNMTLENLRKHSIVHLYFQENYYRGNIRTAFVGFTEFACMYISQVGGIMSLMMGFSVISLVELTYFFIIKPLMKFLFKVFFKNKIHVAKTDRVYEGQMQQQIYQYPDYRDPDTPMNAFSQTQSPPYSANIAQIAFSL